ncbi:GPI inositol deacylase [Entomophthora muscae]|uniref:GPI inositol deacylase n=1 Tax=Entomophthora muscae TaxID=34485 RepID=A0ACC2SJS6_9FUNG|nr:GPI inositol deacylase [Entomophthora muscae]
MLTAKSATFSILLGAFALIATLWLLKSSQEHSLVKHGGCRMTYSMPNYIEITSLPETERGYKLFLFRDGEFDRNGKLYGTPVLFIHGNAGSYKQVRSLAKVSSEQAYQKKGPGLDFFSADFQEEFSALTGELLLKQAEYINDCIGHILKMYSGSAKNPAPTAVLVIGHSMGGVVARAAIRLPNYKTKSINTIITLSTPTPTPECL